MDPSSSAIYRITHASWQRSLQPSQWETLVKSAASKENISVDRLPEEILLSLLTHVTNPSHPSPLHLSYLTHSLLLTHPPLIPPLALLSALLTPTTVFIPPHLASLLLASIPFPLPLTHRLSSSQTFIFLTLLATSDSDAFLKLAPRVMAAPILDEANEGGANQHHLGVEVVLQSLTGKTGEDADFVRGVLQSYVVLGGGGSVATMHAGGDEVDRTVLMLLTGEGGGAAGGEHGMEGMGDMTGMDGVLSIGGDERGGEGLVDGSLVESEADAIVGVDTKMGDLLLLSLTSQPSTARLSIIRAALSQLAPSPVHLHPVLLLSLYISAFGAIATGASTRTFALCILPSLLTSLSISRSNSTWLLRALLSSSSSPTVLLNQIDAREDAKVEPKRRQSTILHVDDDGMNAMDLMGGGDFLTGDVETTSSSEKARHPSISVDLVERFAELGLIDEDVARKLGFDGQGRIRVETGGREIQSFYSDILNSNSSSEELGRIFSSALVDYMALPALASTFMEKHTSWTTEFRDLDALSHFAGFFLSTPESILHLDAIFELIDDGPKTITREGIWFLEEFASDGYGDTQGILAQYGQVALFLQVVIRRYDLSRTHLGGLNGRSITIDIFRSSSIVYPLSKLSEEDRGLIGGWIAALYGPEGIADDLLRSTPPRTLLRLSTTIIAQSIMASQRQIIDLETLTNGISYFFQPLLSWCLVGILDFLSREVRRLGLYSTSHLQTLQLLVLSPACPRTVLSLAGGNILRLLETESGLDLVLRQGGGFVGQEVKARILEARGTVLPPSATSHQPPPTQNHQAALQTTLRTLFSASPSAAIFSLPLHYLPASEAFNLILSVLATTTSDSVLIKRAVALIALPFSSSHTTNNTPSTLVEPFLLRFIHALPGHATDAQKELVAGVRRMVEALGGAGGGRGGKVVGWARKEVESWACHSKKTRGRKTGVKKEQWREELREERHLGEGLMKA